MNAYISYNVSVRIEFFPSFLKQLFCNQVFNTGVKTTTIQFHAGLRSNGLTLRGTI